MLKIRKHKEAFEKIYKSSSYLDNGLRFPLLDIDHYDWERGPENNKYFSYFYKRFSCHILSRLNLEDSQRILIVGCGAGSDEKNIKNLFSRVELWSIDISEEMVKRAIASKSPSNFSLAIAEKLPFPDASFDRVLSREVIEHVINPQLMLDEIFRVLKPGGLAVITTENEESYSPVNVFNNNFEPRVSKFLDYFPSLEYKDKAPTLNEFKLYCDNSQLTLTEFFYDGALYKYLPVKWSLFSFPVIRSLLKPKLVAIAHFFSALENNKKTARIFCDQVKYVLKKDINTESSSRDKISYVCPVCYSNLDDSKNCYTCCGCGSSYFLVRGIHNFIVADDRIDEPFDTIYNAHATKDPKRKPMIYNILKYGFLIFYSFFYIISASLVTFAVKKNTTPLSAILSKKDPFQKYLTI